MVSILFIGIRGQPPTWLGICTILNYTPNLGMFHVKQSQCCTFYTASFAATATRLLDFYAQLQRPEIENRSKMISLNVIQYNSLMTPTMWHFVLGNAWSQHYLLRSGSKIMRRRQRENLCNAEKQVTSVTRFLVIVLPNRQIGGLVSMQVRKERRTTGQVSKM